jgi:hypothetical protein
MTKKITSMLLSLHFTYLVFFSISVSFDFPCTLAFFPERLSNPCQGLRRTFPRFAYSLSGPSRNLIRPDTRLQLREHNKSGHPPSCLKFCTLAPVICWYYHLPLHHATKPAVQIAEPVPEIIDSPFVFNQWVVKDEGLEKPRFQ